MDYTTQGCSPSVYSHQGAFNIEVGVVREKQHCSMAVVVVLDTNIEVGGVPACPKSWMLGIATVSYNKRKGPTKIAKRKTCFPQA